MDKKYQSIHILCGLMLLGIVHCASANQLSEVQLSKFFNQWLEHRASMIYADDPQFAAVQQHSGNGPLQAAEYQKNYANIFGSNLISSLTGIDTISKQEKSLQIDKCQALDVGEKVQRIIDDTLYPLNVAVQKPTSRLFMPTCFLVPMIFHRKGSPGLVGRSSSITDFDTVATVLKVSKLASMIIDNCAYQGSSSSCKVNDTIKALDDDYKIIEPKMGKIKDFLIKYTDNDKKDIDSFFKTFYDARDTYRKFDPKNELKKTDYDTITSPWQGMVNYLENFYYKQVAEAVSVNAPATTSPLSLSALLNPKGYIRGTADDTRAKTFVSYLRNVTGSASILPGLPFGLQAGSDDDNHIVVNGKIMSFNQMKQEPGGQGELASLKPVIQKAILDYQETRKAYLRGIRANIARNNVAVSNFYDMYAHRARSPGMRPSNPNWRIDSKQWYADMKKASPTVIDRQSLYLLADMNQQLVRSNVLIERLLATMSMQFIQAGESSESNKRQEEALKKIKDIYVRMTTGKSSMPSSSSAAGTNEDAKQAAAAASKSMGF